MSRPVTQGSLPATQSARGQGSPWPTLVAVALGVVMVALDGTVVAIANPGAGGRDRRHRRERAG